MSILVDFYSVETEQNARAHFKDTVALTNLSCLLRFLIVSVLVNCMFVLNNETFTLIFNRKRRHLFFYHGNDFLRSRRKEMQLSQIHKTTQAGGQRYSKHVLKTGFLVFKRISTPIQIYYQLLTEDYDKYRTQNISFYIFAAKQMGKIRERCHIVMINWSSILYGENELLR